MTFARVFPSLALVAILLRLASTLPAAERLPSVVIRRVPDGGIQPQVAVGKDGSVHLIYFQGEAAAGDVFYCSSPPEDDKFSEPVRVNSQPLSAIAVGTIRGAHLAVGKEGRVHVAWNGSGKATPRGLANPDVPEGSPYRFSSPMLYTRGEVGGTRFEPQRNLMTHTYALDGGGSLAADGDGHVYVVWHANSLRAEGRGESSRAVWGAVSRDEGATFSAERRINVRETGACGCCGLRAGANERGELFVLYRSAEQSVNRDMQLLLSKDRGRHFDGTMLDAWEVPQCVMSSASLLATNGQMLAAWETKQQIKFARVDDLAAGASPLIWGPKAGELSRKHPVLAVNANGQILVAWTEGTGWQKGGALAWQLFDRHGTPLPDAAGRVEGIPVWSFAGAYAHPHGDDGFTIIY